MESSRIPHVDSHDEMQQILAFAVIAARWASSSGPAALRTSLPAWPCWSRCYRRRCDGESVLRLQRRIVIIVASAP